MYSAAFTKLFKCEPSDFKIIVSSDGHAALVTYKEQNYLIEPYYSLYAQVKGHLTDADTAQHLDIDLLASATVGILKNMSFHFLLVQMLNNEQEKALYQLALSICSFADSKEAAFWHILWPLDETGSLLSKATRAAANAIGVDAFTEQLLQLQIHNGHQFYNELPEGIFEKVVVQHGDDTELVIFIYSVTASTIVC
jgi:hypothetical protein